MKPVLLLLGSLFISACSTNPPIATVKQLDLERFMGKWYVIANIPTFIEKNAYNAVEIYQLQPDQTIQTTFRFNKGSFDGELVEYHPVGRVVDHESNAIWTMQFIWPFAADYRVVHVDENYNTTIVGRNQRDYVWIMARTPDISGEEFKRLLAIIIEQGYDAQKVQRVPHQYQPRELAWRT